MAQLITTFLYNIFLKIWLFVSYDDKKTERTCVDTSIFQILIIKFWEFKFSVFYIDDNEKSLDNLTIFPYIHDNLKYK